MTARTIPHELTPSEQQLRPSALSDAAGFAGDADGHLADAGSLVTEGRASTGVVGLDEILHGGFIPGRAYVIDGGPGSGKTTLGLHFLDAGVADGQRSLFVSLGESESKIRADAGGVGFSDERIEVLDVSADVRVFTEGRSFDVFGAAQRVIAHVQEQRYDRVFVDSVTQLQFLTDNPLQLRAQLFGFLEFLTDSGATVVVSAEDATRVNTDDLRFAADGVITLTNAPTGRHIEVTKFRGSDYAAGRHSMAILRQRGIVVYPRLVPRSHGCGTNRADVVPSGIPNLDRLMGGGLARGSVTILTGPTGVGKTTVGMQFMKEAAGRGEHSAAFLFDETAGLLVERCRNLNMPVDRMIERGTLHLIETEALQYSPDHFAQLVREQVEVYEASIIMLDSVAGYRLSFDDNDIDRHLHALGRYLTNMGVTALLVNESRVIVGPEFRVTEYDVSHIADSVVFMKYRESGDGAVDKVIGMLKKRSGPHEVRLRPLQMSAYGLDVGEPLSDAMGVFTGIRTTRPSNTEVAV